MKKILICMLLAISQPVLAEPNEPTEDERIVVVASGSSLAIDSTGQSINVLTLADIQQAQGVDLTRALERVPGLSWTRNGGPGSFTGVRLRGADSEQVLVLVDGVRVEDVSAPSGGFDFGTLAPGEIGRIEVLRGSNSVPWGSAALGGVVALTTRAIDGAEVQVEYGNHDTLNGQALVGLAGEDGRITASGGYARSDGVSAAATGSEADGYSNWHAGVRGALALAPGLDLVGNARLADTRTQIDGFPPPTYFIFGDTPEFQDTRQASGRAMLTYASDGFDLNSGVSLASTRRDYFDPTFSTDPSFGYRGRSLRWEMTGRARLPADLRLDFGADNEWNHFTSTFDARATARATSGHAQLGWVGDAGTLAIGLRRDDHNRFGGAWTLGGNGTLRLPEDLRLLASYGEGFKAPTLFQLLSSYGNVGLRPERSHSMDIGVAYDGEGLALSATIFNRQSRNLIAFVSCASLNRCADRPYGLYDNVARTRAQGLEVEANARLSETLHVSAAYAYTRARNRSGISRGNDLARRPEQMLTTAIDWTGDHFAVGADLRWVGASFDDAANARRLRGHALAALRAKVPLTGKVALFGRIENLFNSRYETVADYGTWGRAAFIGFRAEC